MKLQISVLLTCMFWTDVAKREIEEDRLGKRKRQYWKFIAGKCFILVPISRLSVQDIMRSCNFGSVRFELYFFLNIRGNTAPGFGLQQI